MIDLFGCKGRNNDFEKSVRWSLRFAIMEERFENRNVRPRRSKLSKPPKNPRLTLSVCAIVFGLLTVLAFICKAWVLGVFVALVTLACVVALI